MPKTRDGGPGAGPGGDTRNRLLTAAAELIGEQGWAGVTTRAVAERAGINPGLVHYHFESIEGLRVAGATRAVEAMAAGSLASLRGDGPVVDALLAALREMVRNARSGPLALVTSELLVRAGRDPGLRSWMGRVLAGYRDLLGEAIRRAVANGEIRAGDPGALATVLAAVVDGLLLHAIADPELPLDPALGALERLLRPDEQEHP